VGATQPPIRCVPGALPLRSNNPERVEDYAPPSSAEFRNGGAIYFHSPIRLRGA
jgi:hypothetical protein